MLNTWNISDFCDTENSRRSGDCRFLQYEASRSTLKPTATSYELTSSFLRVSYVKFQSVKHLRFWKFLINYWWKGSFNWLYGTRLFSKYSGLSHLKSFHLEKSTACYQVETNCRFFEIFFLCFFYHHLIIWISNWLDLTAKSR